MSRSEWFVDVNENQQKIRCPKGADIKSNNETDLLSVIPFILVG
jgi:hypothetical protein